MKTKFLLGAGLGVCALAWAAKDPVIMTVNGVDVPKSEFEYLYHKNSQQQLAPQPIDEYVDMFVNYRLKVADACAAGIDTTAAFRQEMAQYRHDLAAPYMADSVFLNTLVKESFDRSRQEVETSHIMLFKTPSAADNAKAVVTLDSIRAVLLSGADFAEMAKTYSQDRGTKGRGGSMGFITTGRYPYKFEEAAFALQPGEISEVVESPVGYHLIKSGAHRPARGTVKAAHILVLDQGASAEESAKHKALIDSIYAVVKAQPSKFEEMAFQFSDDKGSARQGGQLQWFGAGMMVQEFDSVAFAMPVGEISEPFRTQFGWHIIHKLDRKDPPSLQEMKPMELARISNPQDERNRMVKRNLSSILSKKHGMRVNDAALAPLRAYAAEQGIDSLFFDKFNQPAYASAEVIRIGKKPYMMKDMLGMMRQAQAPAGEPALKLLDAALENFEDRELMDVEESWLEENNADYRNLLHEYTNGSLLYEASVRNVWDKAAKDTEGLQDFFDQNRSNYTWDTPRAKGILVQAKNDSVANDISRRYLELPADEAVNTLKKEYKGEAQIDRVLVPQGQNPLVDALMFGTGSANPSNASYTVCIMLDGRIIDAPEEIGDVKGLVTGDYQEALEQAWIADLRAKYPVTINRKVLSKVK